MWSGSVISKDVPKPGIVSFTVEYVDDSDPGRTFTRGYNREQKSDAMPIAVYVEMRVHIAVDQLEAADAALTGIPLGIVAAPDAPDAGWLLMQQDMRKSEFIERMVNLGVITKEAPKAKEVIDRIAANLNTYWDQL